MIKLAVDPFSIFAMATVPPAARDAVMKQSEPMGEDSRTVEGYDFNKGNDVATMIRDFYPRMGFQASHMGEAISIINEMVRTLFSR